MSSVEEEVVPEVAKEETSKEETSKPAKKKIVIGLPGDSFSSKFLISWTGALNVLWESQKYEIIISPGVSSFVTFARCKLWVSMFFVGFNRNHLIILILMFGLQLIVILFSHLNNLWI